MMRAFKSQGNDAEIELSRSVQNQFRVLIVNDEEMQLTVLKMLFTRQKFNVSTAKNGFEAFEMVKDSSDSINRMFDLIIMDLNMPISDGFEST